MRIIDIIRSVVDLYLYCYCDFIEFLFKDDGSIILRKFWFRLEIIYYFENT